MADLELDLWGVFPHEDRWGVFKFNLVDPEAVFDDRAIAVDWAFKNANPSDFNVLRVADADGNNVAE
jgi:hypothetical protein